MIRMARVFLIISLIIIANLVVLAFNKNYAAEVLSGEELRLYLGEVRIISVNNPTRIVIGNPSIADVTDVSKTEITVTPKAVGKTSVVFWDNFGEQSYQVRVFAEDIIEFKRRIDNLLKKIDLPEVYTQAEEDEGKVLLLGRVKSAEDKNKIMSTLGALAGKALDLIKIKEEESIVDIDVQLLELNQDATKSLGFSWPTAVELTDVSGPITDGVTGLKNVFHVSDYTRSAFNMRVDALIQQGKARVLSRPRLSCQSGKEATLLVGGEKPIFSTQVTIGGSGTKVEYKEYGIKLKINPTVTENGRIKLILNVEISEIGAAESIGPTGGATAQAYPLTKRTAATELALNDGQTLAIGGLIKQKTEESLNKVPWLGDLPILGLLFRKRTTEVGGGYGARGNTELFITLTPRLIGGEKKAEQEKKEDKPKIASSSGRAVNLPDSVEGYTEIIQKSILENLTYPALAQQAGLQGTVRLNLRLSRSGELLELLVKDSSGHRILDDQAIAVAKSIVSYPPFPSSIDKQDIWIEVPIIYQLN